MNLKNNIYYIIMTNRCYICMKDLKDINISVDAHLVNNQVTWRDHYENNEHKYYFAKRNITTCKCCFKKLTGWDNKKNKISFLKDRQLKGIKPKLKFPIIVKVDKCAMCETDTQYQKNDTIYNRDNYISGIGQLCQECYFSVTRDRMTFSHMYENYLL